MKKYFITLNYLIHAATKKIKLSNKKIWLTDESYIQTYYLKIFYENFNKQYNRNKYLILGDIIKLKIFKSTTQTS